MNNMPLVKRIAIDVLLAVLMCVIPIGIFAYFMHRSYMIEENSDKALSISRTVAAALDTDQYTEIMRTGQPNEYYTSFKAFLDEVLARSSAKYLYVIDANYSSNVLYFAEGYPAGGRPGEPELGLGATESVDSHDPELFDTLKTGNDMIGDIADVGGFGVLVSGYSAVLDSSGRVLAVVGVDFDMSKVMSSVNRFGLLMIGISVIMIIIVTIITVVVCKKTFIHLTHMAQGLEQIGMKGDLQLSPDVKKSAMTTSAWTNEIGVCARAVGGLLKHLDEQERTLSAVAEGDLSVEVHILSDRDVMGNAMAKMVERLHEMFAGIHTGASQVLAGSKQIAEGSQSVARGSSEQASTIERLSATITALADTTMNNTQMAGDAAALSASVETDAQQGSAQMEQMLQAVSEINSASRNIEKVIKVIDDIAFQTNILALNAAVEAARAGQHGKGFAVVAEEVRSLASKSAEAAKDTGTLITTSMEKAALGSKIAEETSESLHGIVEGINKSAVLVSEIARVSGEQAASIEEISGGISQVVNVVTQNSAAAEQSSAASEEMSSQANILEGMVAQFRLKDGRLETAGSYGAEGRSFSKNRRIGNPEQIRPDYGDYGKY